MSDITIRNVTPDDADELLEIYAPYVAETAISFEIDIPTAEDFRSRIEHTLKNYPYIAAIKDGHIVGYAYASAFHPREAYNRCAELTVYIKRICAARAAESCFTQRLRICSKSRTC